MRRNIIASSVLLALLALTVGFNGYSSPTRFDADLQELESRIIVEDWSQAEEIYTNLNKDWRKRRIWVQFTKSTDTITGIDRALSRLGASLRSQSKPNAMAELSDLSTMWRDLKE